MSTQRVYGLSLARVTRLKLLPETFRRPTNFDPRHYVWIGGPVNSAGGFAAILIEERGYRSVLKKWMPLWIGVLCLLIVIPVQAQDRSVYWERWKWQNRQREHHPKSVSSDRSYDLSFSGTFQFGSAAIRTPTLTIFEMFK
ncbi:MAG: hypothetical protein U0670_19395 [Anaerolineae bacterium]